MKKSTFLKAFTLIELLTVMAIIAILMGLLFPAIASVKESARKTQAKNDLMQTVNAVKAYFTEYGKYPLIGKMVDAVANDNKDTVYGDPGGLYKNHQLYDILRSRPGDDPETATTGTTTLPGNKYNPRHIVFFEGNDAKDITNPRGGFAPADAANEVTKGDLVDPWGHAYIIFIDANNDNVIDLFGIYKDLGSQETGTPRLSVGGASLGKDGLKGNKGDMKYQGSDDIISWQ